MCVALALPASASAEQIDGNPLRFLSSGNGRFQTYYYDYLNYEGFYHAMGGNADADAGLHLAVYNSALTSATVYGPRGNQAFTAGSAPTLAGNGSTTPYTLTSTYTAGSLSVEETATYVDGDKHVRVHYAVTNNSGAALPIRATIGGDVTPAYDEGGMGQFKATAPRQVSTLNPNQGANVYLEEVSGVSAFDGWWEDDVIEVWRRVLRPLEDGLKCTLPACTPGWTNPGDGDKALAVQFDDHRDTPLANGATAHYEVVWRFSGYDALELTRSVTSSYRPTYTSVSATASSVLEDGSSPNTQPILYRVTGQHPVPAGGGWQPASVTGPGAGSVPAWQGTRAGWDSLEVFVDINNDGERQGFEATESTSFRWFDQLELEWYDWSYTGTSTTANLQIYDENWDYLSGARDFEWWVVGANDTGSSASPQTGTTNANGWAEIDWAGSFGGTDTLYVRADLNEDGTVATGPSETRSISGDWDSSIDVSTNHTPTVGVPFTTWVYDYYSAVTGPIRWMVNDGSPQTVTMSGSSGSFQYTCQSTGEIQLSVYQDTNPTAGWQPGEPRVNETIECLASGVTRLAISPATQQTKTVGGTQAWNLTLRDSSGNLADGAVRYEVDGGPNDSGNVEAEVAATGGAATINLTDAAGTGGTDYVSAYADRNGNDRRDNNDPTVYTSVRWAKHVDLSTAQQYRDVGPYGSPGSSSVNVKLRDAAAFVTGPFTWEIVSGPNAGLSGSGEVTDANAGAAVSWPATTTGTDMLEVTATIDSVERSATIRQDWYNDLSLTPASQSRETDQTASVQPHLSGYGSNANRVYRWKREGVSAPSPVYGSVTANSNGNVPPITWTSSSTGLDTLTVWVDLDDSGASAPTAGDEALVAKVTWTPDLVSIDVPSDLSVGATATATATLLNGANQTVIGEALRYRVTGQHYSYGKLFAETDLDGQISFSWPSTRVGNDEVDVWLDTDRDGYWDASTEPGDRESVRWHPLIDITSATTNLREGNTQNVTVTLRDVNYAPQSRPLKYRITGPNPRSATPITPDATTGEASISWVGYEPGYDELEVWEDEDGSGAPNDGELTTTEYYYWSRRVFFTGDTYSKATGTQRTVYAHIDDLAGNRVPSGTVIHWGRTGANDVSGTQTATTDSNGRIAITWTGENSGEDVLKVWHDSLTADGERDPGEPQATVTLGWYNQISLSPAGATKWIGQQHTVTVGGSISTNLRFARTGANPGSGTTSQGAAIQWTGTNAGSDQLVVWQDQNTDGDRDFGEPASAAYVTFRSPAEVTVQNANLTAGGTGSARIVTYLGTSDASNPTIAPSTQVTWEVTGVNPAGPTTTTTDADGDVTINWSAVNAGTDTVKVWVGASNAGAPAGTDSVTWSPPPVAVSLTPTSQTKYAGNTQQFTATVTGTTIPGGGVPVTWRVTGANPQGPTTTNTDNAGVLTFTVTGTTDGIDTVRVDADLAGNYDPNDTSQVTWLPLVEIPSGTSRTPALGSQHDETVRLLDPALSTPGNPVGLANTNVLWELEAGSANATNGIQTRTAGSASYRPAGTTSGVNSRTTDGSGYVTISWVGQNAGTDNLVVYGDTNGDGAVQANEPRARTSVVWGQSSSSGAAPTLGTTTGTPTAGAAQVPPASDFDGLPTPPPPVTGRAVNIEPVSGRVLVRLPGSNMFIDLLDAEQVPIGTVVDVRGGRVELTSTKDLRGGIQAAEFYKGMFKIGQNRAAKPVTDLALFGGNFNGCGKPARGGAPHGSAAANKKRVIRRLWGSGKGQFRTRGRYAAAALRGTDWETVDRCDGTLVRVRKGVVAVTDLVRKRTVVVRAGKQYFAAARRG